MTDPNGWRPIESAPRDGTMILLYGATGYIGIGSLEDTDRWSDGIYTRCEQFWSGHRPGDVRPGVWGGGDKASSATHWQPLPAPPAQGGE